MCSMYVSVDRLTGIKVQTQHTSCQGQVSLPTSNYKVFGRETRRLWKRSIVQDSGREASIEVIEKMRTVFGTVLRGKARTHELSHTQTCMLIRSDTYYVLLIHIHTHIHIERGEF